MAYSYDFKNNVVYGAEDINGIRASILTKGVVEETSDSCKAEFAEGKVKISEGQAIFTDGSRIKIDKNGVLLDYETGKVNYVFFLNNTLAGICEISCQDSLPDDDYILIAEIDEESNLKDKRKFVQLKTADIERFATSFSAEFQMSTDMTENDVIGVISMPKSNCSLIKLYVSLAQDFTQVTILPKENIIIWHYGYSGLFEMGETQEIYDGSEYTTLRYEVSGDKLIVRFVSTTEKDVRSKKLKIVGICQR